MPPQIQAQQLPCELLERLTTSWQAACGTGRALSFQHDVASLCKRYGPSASNSSLACDHSGSDLETASTTTARGSALPEKLHLHQLPDDLLAAILRRTLDPDHPGSLCSSTYTSDLQDTSVLRNDRTYRCARYLASNFSREALRQRSASGPMPAILVCKRWHRTVLQGSVIRALAVGFPSRLPLTLDTLMLRLERTPNMSDELIAAYQARASSCVQGLKRVSEVVCGCPVAPQVVLEPLNRYLAWPFAVFAPMLPRLPGLTKLDISNCKVSDPVLHGPLRSLGNMTNLVSLSLCCLRLRDHGIEVLAPCLGRLTKLTHLDLSGNSMGTVGLKHLVAHVTNLSLLRSLHLKDNSAMRDNDADEDVSTLQSLVSYITSLGGLQDLDLLTVYLNEDALNAAVAGLALMPDLRTVKMHTGEHGHKIASALFSLLPDMTALEDLTLMSFSDGVEQAIRRQVRQPLTLAPTPLKRLFLCGPVWYAFRDVVAEPRAPAFAALTSLAIERCELMNTDLENLVPHLPGLSGLRQLSLSANGLTPGAIALLAPHMCHLSALTSLDLSYNNIDDSGSDALINILAPLWILEELNLSYNGLSGECLRAGFARSLGELRRLRVLELRGNPLGHFGVLALAPYLRSWPRLSRLGLDYVDGCGCQGESVCRSCTMLLAVHAPDEARLAALNTGVLETLWDSLRAWWGGMRATCEAPGAAFGAGRIAGALSHHDAEM